jgi:hypothetical protein
MAHLNQDVLLFIIKRTKEEEEEEKNKGQEFWQNGLYQFGCSMRREIYFYISM